MVISFPNSPSTNDIHSQGALSWRWNGSSWLSVNAGVQGAQGLQGLQGIQGITGAQGTFGTQGAAGFVGSNGAQGAQGIQGINGVQGINGSNGAQGTQGTQGIQGLKGTKITPGDTAPASPSENDLWWDSTNGILMVYYNDGTSAQWVTANSGIAGEQGIQGIQGVQGIQGTQGTQGVQGIQGVQGTQGTQGVQGIQGITGLAFTIAKTYLSVAALTADTAPTGIVAGQFALINTSDVQNSENSRLYIWTGSAYTFVDDLSGSAGIQGITGSQGVQGIQGTLGAQGITGSQGAQGTQGIQGIQGISGASILGLNNTFTGVNSININGTVGATTRNTVAATTLDASKGSSGTVLNLLSGNASYYTDISIGRTAQEWFLGLAAAASNYASGTVAGDLVLGASGAANLFFGINNSVVGKFTATGLNSTAIGATTASTGAFTTLSASGTATVGPNNTGTGLGLLQLFGGSGSNGGGSIYFGTNGTAYSSIGQASGILGGTSTDFVIYANNGSQNIKFYAGGGGNVGTFSSTGLAVTGQIDATSTFRAIAGGGGVSQLNFVGNTGNLNAQIQYDQVAANSGQLFFGTNNAGTFATRLTITKEGNVGIGATPPSQTTASELSIRGYMTLGQYGASQSTGYLGWNVYSNHSAGNNSYKARVSGDNAGVLEFNSGGGLVFSNSNATGTAGSAITLYSRFCVDAAGNVGIGTTNPDAGAKLTVTGGILATGAFSATTGSTAGFDYFGGALRLFSNGTSGSTKGAYSFIAKGADGSSSNPVTIDSNGNLLVGTTSAYVSSRFRVKSSGSDSGTYNTELENSAGTVLFTVRDDGYISTGVAAASPYNATTASAANCMIYSDGGLYRSTSSRKYKRDITDYTRGLADVLKLRPVFYKGKSENDGDTQFAGLIAEEVADAGLDEFVVKAADGTPDALSYGNMVALTIKAIQELNANLVAQVADLSQRLAVLESK